MESQLLKIAFRSLLILFGLFAVACAPNQSPPEPSLNESDNESVQRSPDVKEVEIPGGGRGRIKPDGWQIPDLTSVEKAAEFKVEGAKTIDGIEAVIEGARYRPVFGDILVPSEMATEMGVGDLNVQGVIEYKAKDRTFAYMFSVNQVELDKASNKIKSSRGVIFRFVIYDEDGDGKFETLATDEPSVDGRLRPHVPAWAGK